MLVCVCVLECRRGDKARQEDDEGKNPFWLTLVLSLRSVRCTIPFDSSISSFSKSKLSSRKWPMARCSRKLTRRF